MSRILLWRTRSEIAKNCAEIVAFVAAAWWAIHTFAIRDKPTLEPHIDGDAKLTWEAALAAPDFCQAVWTISIQNTGNTPVDIGSVQVRLWSFVPLTPRPGKVTYFDLEGTRPPDGKYEFDQTFRGNDAPLTGRLHPRDVVAHDFKFMVPRSPAGDLIGFDLQLFEGAGHTNLKYIYDSAQRCQPTAVASR